MENSRFFFAFEDSSNLGRPGNMSLVSLIQIDSGISSFAYFAL